MLNQQVFKGNWTELRGRVREKWRSVTEDDLVLSEGDAGQLIGIIQRRTGDSREKIEHELDQMASDYDSKMDKVRRQASEAVGSAKEAVGSAKESAREYADRAGQAAHQRYEQFQEQYGQVAEGVQARMSEAEAAVRRNPIESLCVAFGTGLIAGVVVGLAFRSRD